MTEKNWLRRRTRESGAVSSSQSDGDQERDRLRALCVLSNQLLWCSEVIPTLTLHSNFMGFQVSVVKNHSQCRKERGIWFSHWFGNIPWRKRQPFPRILAWESQGQASLVGYSLGIAMSQVVAPAPLTQLSFPCINTEKDWVRFILNKKVAKDSYSFLHLCITVQNLR